MTTRNQSPFRVERAPGRCSGEPVLVGTRMTVSSLYHFAEDGFSVSAIRRQYPHLTPTEILVGVAFEQGRRDAIEQAAKKRAARRLDARGSR